MSKFFVLFAALNCYFSLARSTQTLVESQLDSGEYEAWCAGKANHEGVYSCMEDVFTQLTAVADYCDVYPVRLHNAVQCVSDICGSSCEEDRELWVGFFSSVETAINSERQKQALSDCSFQLSCSGDQPTYEEDSQDDDLATLGTTIDEVVGEYVGPAEDEDGFSYEEDEYYEKPGSDDEDKQDERESAAHGAEIQVLAYILAGMLASIPFYG